MANPVLRTLGVFCALVAVVALTRQERTPPARAVAAAMPATVSPWAPEPTETASARNSFAPATVLARDAGGTFHIAGAINGRALDMLVDTGADVVAIPVGEAAGLGIVVQPDAFRPILRTASGTANGAPVRIDSLHVAGSELRDVDGVVVEGLDRVLLGQSALRRLGKVSIEGDRMEIGAN